MYGLIGKMMAATGKRDELLEALREGITGMPRCLAYDVAEDEGDPGAFGFAEVWVDEASRRASLQLEGVRRAIERARPLIAGFGERFVPRPAFGVGLGSDDKMG